MDFSYLIGIIYSTYGLAISGLENYFHDLKEEKLSNWLNAYWRHEMEVGKNSLASESHDFWTTDDSNLLMHYYYRGFPKQFIGTFSKEQNLLQIVEQQKTNWMLDEVLDAENSCKAHFKKISEAEVDSKRGHRLYAFPQIVAAQFLPHADKNTINELCWGISSLLNNTQNDAGSFTESARDQINQIIPQVLIDQLLAGPIAWNSLVVTKDVLDCFFDLGRMPEKAKRFETGLAISLQFLVYYKASLASKYKKKHFADICREQSALIDDYFVSIFQDTFSLDQSFKIWLDAFQGHTISVSNMADPFNNLVRQSSAAVMARHSGAQDVPEKIWHLCILNNLRAAHHSLTLPDCEDRRDRVIRFLSENGVTYNDGFDITNKYVTKKRKDFYDDMQEFIKNLPTEHSEPNKLGPELFSLAHGVTIDQLWAELTSIRTLKKMEDVASKASTIAKPLDVLVTGFIWPIVRRGLNILKNRRNTIKKEQNHLQQLMKKLVNKDSNENLLK